MRKEMIAWVGAHQDIPLAAPLVISQLQRLQQLALGYLEFDGENWSMTEPSAKLDALVGLLEDNPNEQFLVYSQWKQPLRMAARRLDKLRIPWTTYTGDDTQAARDRHKDTFTSGAARVMLGTIG